MSEIQTTVKSITSASPRVKILRINVPNSFTFKPGQFVLVSVPGCVRENGTYISKAFSIASSPNDKGFIELCIAEIKDGQLSPLLCSANSGDPITIAGPRGKFSLQEPVEDNTIFIAGGTGIAPIMSMLRTITSSKSLKLLFGFRTPEDYLYKEELEKMDNVQITIAESRNGDNIYITDMLADLSPADVYVCGPPSMVADTITILKDKGFTDEQIRKEQW